MSERLIINQFAGIEYLELEVKPITLLIGPQASGKSIVAKLLYFFKQFPRSIVPFAELFPKSLTQNKLEYRFSLRPSIDQFKKLFAISLGKPFKISYFYGDHVNLAIIGDENGQVSIELSPAIERAIQTIEEDYKKILPPTAVNPFDLSEVFLGMYGRHMESLTTELFPTYNQIFVPAVRSVYIHIKKQVFKLIDQNESFDPFLINLGVLMSEWKENFYQRQQSVNDDFQSIVRDILRARYESKDDLDYLTHADHRRVALEDSSSGQQESFPLLVTLDTLHYGDIAESFSLYIEEPEAHLFPVAQNQLVRLIARVFNKSQSNSEGANGQIFLTTHSPYLLSSFNNLIEAGSISQKHPHLKEQIKQLVPEHEILAPETIGAYAMGEHGIIDLIDPETGLIGENFLDDISGQIGIQFDKLLDLRFASDEI